MSAIGFSYHPGVWRCTSCCTVVALLVWEAPQLCRHGPFLALLRFVPLQDRDISLSGALRIVVMVALAYVLDSREGPASSNTDTNQCFVCGGAIILWPANSGGRFVDVCMICAERRAHQACYRSWRRS